MSVIFQVTSWLSSAAGGVPAVIRALVAEYRRRQMDCVVAGLAGPDGAPPAFPEDWPVLSGRIAGPAGFGYSPELARQLRGRAQKDSVIHAHGLWMYPGWLARQLSGAAGAARIVSPHGMLEPWALRNSRWKKQFAAWAFENENLGSASCLHALCATEVEDFRRRGLKNPIALIPNGIDPAEYAMLPDRSLLEARFPALRGRQWALFLSRIHPKKGLPNLLKAWAKTRKSDDWTLIVAGPDELGHEAEMKRLAAELELGRDICFTGALRGREKLAALGGARLFVLPSLSEGFSMAMLEAAASGLPMLLTPQCNFPELTAAGGAVEALPNAAGCQAGLARLLAMSPSELAAMGARGRRLVHKSYTWAIVAGQMLDVYRWMQGAGPKPECIV